MNKINWEHMADKAWKMRDNAHIYGNTKVGACLLAKDGNYYTGCNIEQRFRNKDIHAEVNAITNMVSSGVKRFRAIIVVSEREQFTPCGTCMDWIFQFGGKDCQVAYQSGKDGNITVFKAIELMPHSPH